MHINTTNTRLKTDTLKVMREQDNTRKTYFNMLADKLLTWSLYRVTQRNWRFFKPVLPAKVEWGKILRAAL
jgi:hypothetical protein